MNESSHVWLVRHARPARQGVFLGRMDVPLDAGAEAESRAGLEQIQAAVVYCSPLERAWRTAVWIAGADKPTVLADLADLDYGSWQGRSWEEIERTEQEVAARKLSDWLGTTPAGGESWAALELRVARALDTILAGPLPAAIVAHEAVNAVVAARLAGTDPLVFHQPFGTAIRLEVPPPGTPEIGADSIRR